MNQNPRISATRVQMHDECARKWWYAEVLGPELPGTPAQALGTAVHAINEDYLLTGVLPQVAPEDDRWLPTQITRAGLDMLAPLRAAVEGGYALVEHAFTIPAGVLGPRQFDGEIDYLEWPHPKGLAIASVLDHKTTSNLKAYWHLDEKGLQRNTQLLAYAIAAAYIRYDRLGIYRTTRIGHLYYQTVPPFGTRQLLTTVSATDLVNAEGRIRRSIEKMDALIGVTDETKVPYNTATCKKYGGCPQRTRCPVSTANQATHHTNLIAAIKQRRASMGLPERTMSMFGKGKDGTKATKGAITPPDAPPENVLPAQVRAVVNRARLLINKGGKLSDKWIALSLDEAGQASDDAAVAQVRALLDQPKPDAKTEIPKTTEQVSDTVLVRKLLEMVANSKRGAIVVETAAEKLMIAPQRVIDLVTGVQAHFDGLWTVDEEDGERFVSRTPEELTAEDIEEIMTHLGSVEEPAADPGDVAADVEAEAVAALEAKRQTLIAELDRAEALAGDTAAAAIREKLGIKRARKAGPDKLRAYIDALTAAVKPKEAAPDDGPLTEEKALELLHRIVGQPVTAPMAIPMATVKARWKDAVGEDIDNEDLFYLLGKGHDAGWWDHSASYVNVPGAVNVGSQGVTVGPVTDKIRGGTATTVDWVAFVGCVPVGLPVASVEAWAYAQIVAVNSQSDRPYEMIPYSDGCKAVVALIRDALADGTLELPENLVIHSRHPLEPYLTAVLAQFGVIIVRATL